MPRPSRRLVAAMAGLLAWMVPAVAPGEAMLQLFNVSYAEIVRKMPELAEAGYTSMWLPPPTKGSGGLSVGYDLWDPFDLGSKDQRNTVRTRYGTEAELLHLMEVAHRFGIRIYFDNIMNHRAFDIPGFNENTDIFIYPGMVPEDFHLRVTEDGFYRKWDNTRDWNSAWQVQNLGLSDLIDIAHETPNANFGPNEGDTHPKYSFVRDFDRPEQYDKDKDGNTAYFGVLIDQAREELGVGATEAELREKAQEYISANRGAFIEDVGAYLIRAVRWKMDRTKADGLRLDAVKHVPDYFYGAQSGLGKDESDAGYLGGVQWQFNRTRGFSDANHRDSVFDHHRLRDDAMVFGEHLGEPPGYGGYWDSGMRLVDNDLRSQLNGNLGNPWGDLTGLDGPGAGGFPPNLGVMHANSHDNDYAALKEWQHAYYFTRDGMGLIYSDGYYKAETLGESGGAFPRHANTNYLGQFGDPRIPNILKIHNDFARGLQEGRWGDGDYVAFERRDNRDRWGFARSGSAADEITMVAMFNDNTAQGQARPISTSFPWDAYLYQYARGPDGSFMGGFYKYAWELGDVVVPPGGYYVFSYRTPEISNLWNQAVTFHQNGREVDRITVTRKDGPDGDAWFNPLGLANRGYPEGTTPEDYSYQTTVPVVKGGSPVTIIARADGSAENILLKLDGGVDLNGGVPEGIGDPVNRDNPPAFRSDIWVGYEQPGFLDRQHPEKFAARIVDRNQTGSAGAETYVKTIGGGIDNDPGYHGPATANNYDTFSGNVAAWVYHDPEATVGGPDGTAGVGGPQFVENAEDLVIWAKSNSVGGGFQMRVYYTTDGSFPEGAGGIGRGTTQVASLSYRHGEDGNDWWGSVSIPKPEAGSKFIYKVSSYKNDDTGVSSWWPADAGSVAYKKSMLTTFRVQDFDPSTVEFFPHNDYGRTPVVGVPYEQWPWATQTGLSEGFHVIRARAFLNRGENQAPLYNTFTQTFYYDAETPTGEVLWPQNNGDTVGGSTYGWVVQTDMTVEEVWYHIDDSDAGNDDATTGVLHGNGPGFEPFEDDNRNGVRDEGEDFTDINGNGVYDDTLATSWAPATAINSINLPGKKEWRFSYNNIPADGSATVTIRLLEASSSRNLTLDATTGHTGEIARTVVTDGPDERVNIAWPQRDGDRVDDNYTMKVYFTKILSDGLTEQQLKDRFIFTIASTENGTNRNPIQQSQDGWQINYGSFGSNGEFHELSIPLPNLYNDIDDFLHTLRVVYNFPDGREREANRLVTAAPSTKPFIRITQPAVVDSDGRQIEIILPDTPGDNELNYTVRAETSASVTNVALTGTPPIELFDEPFTDTNGNGFWDDEEPSTDANNNGQWDAPEVFVDANANGVYDVGEDFTDTNENGIRDAGEVYTDVNENGEFDTGENFYDTNENRVRDVAEPFTDTNGNGARDGVKVVVNGNTKVWDFTWRITSPGNYQLRAEATTGDAQNAVTTRNAKVILRQIVEGDGIQDNDDDNDGLLDINETNQTELPEGNVETWSNGDVHIWRATGRSLPLSPDSDGDGLPDGLEVGWRNASNPPTDTAADTNGDGFPNFAGDLDPPLYAVLEHAGFVPGVGDASKGDDRTRQAAGSVTDPGNPDTDNDGLPDGIEDANRNGWTDGDGAALPVNANREDYATHRPNTGDWPNDFIDSFETWTETSPTNPDSDGDGLSDGYGEDINFNGYIDGDTNRDRLHNSGELWSETDPLNPDTDGDGLPDGWEVQYGLDALDDGQFSKRLDGAGDINNGPEGDPDGDGFTNAQELASGTNPTRDDRVPPISGEGAIEIGTFGDWTHEDLLVLDEYNENPANGGADVYRSGNDSSRDIVAFSFRDGGDVEAGGTGLLYFRVDFMDLAAFAEEGEVDAYIVIDTGNPAAGERAIPNGVDIATDMRWEVVVAAYNQDFGTIFVDRSTNTNTTTQFQDPVTDGGVEPRGFGGDNLARWSSVYDALEISIERRHLKDAGWLGDPDSLNFQVFTTKPNTAGDGDGNLPGRNDIRDTIYDDWLASDWWRDQDNISLNGKLVGYFSRNGANDRNRSAKVMLLAHGNQAIQPASTTQALLRSGDPAAGYSRLVEAHETHRAPLTLHITPTLASAIQWAANPAAGDWPSNDGPSFNARLAQLRADGLLDVLGSTFADHIPKYFPLNFNNQSVALGNSFLDTIYGGGNATTSRDIFWAPERVLDDATLATISSMGYSHTFVDQKRHLLKWFGRSSALGTAGFRINEVNGVKLFPIHDDTSIYLDQTRDGGSAQPIRELLSRRARSGVQDQVVVLWRDMGDFTDPAKADSYDDNVRWLSSRPWIRVVTASDIVNGFVSYVGQDGNTYGTWGTEWRGTNQTLEQTAKDWIDHATGENYDNWYFGSANEEGLYDRTFGANRAFGQPGNLGYSDEIWSSLTTAGLTDSLQPLDLVAGSMFHAAMFQTAFHNTTNNDLRKFSTGDYIYPDTDSGQTLAEFARVVHSQARHGGIFVDVQNWAASANATTLVAEARDVDYDDIAEYILYNNRLFALFTSSGGRLLAAWMRDPANGKVWQVAGNLASYAGTDTEYEGESNFLPDGTTLDAYRTSGFKDWWVVAGGSGTNANVNAAYSALITPENDGVAFTNNAGLTKTIRLPSATSERLEATYSLTGVAEAYIRFGLSPNLLDLMKNGHANLADEVVDGNRVNLVNDDGTDTVRAFLIAPEINVGATDKSEALTTYNRRNQAQTHQVEIKLAGEGDHVVTLGFDMGTDIVDNPDSDNDGLPDEWEITWFGDLSEDGNGNPDGDSWTNANEYHFGSNPTDASSGAPRSSVRKDGDGFHFTFDTVAERYYQPKVRDALMSGDWENLGGQLTGDGSEKTVTDTYATEADRPTRFYRLEITPTPPAP